MHFSMYLISLNQFIFSSHKKKLSLSVLVLKLPFEVIFIGLIFQNSEYILAMHNSLYIIFYALIISYYLCQLTIPKIVQNMSNKCNTNVVRNIFHKVTSKT